MQEGEREPPDGVTMVPHSINIISDGVIYTRQIVVEKVAFTLW